MKVILISDLHLRDYHRYNKFPGQRLSSFMELAKDIVEVGRKEKVNTLIIGGDLIDKSTLSPKEVHTLFKMFTILASHFKIYSIFGNHDLKMKKGDPEKEDTLVTLLEEIDNIEFLHQKIITLGGRTFAFESWMPEFTLDWITEPTDVYISHVDIDYDQTGFYGRSMEPFEGKFKLGFFGDIHVRREIENYISIGNTKQESLSDRWQGGGIILDTKDLSWERFDIDPEHKKYLHLTTTDELELEGWVDAEGEDMTYRIYKPAKVNNSTVNFTLPKTTDIEEKLNQIMKELDLLDLHNSIKSGTDYSPIDFNFKLQKLIIKNFRSITDYTLDFNEDYVVTGPNGSGKSTMITALFYALIGKKTLKQDVTFGEKDCMLTLYLTYQNQDFILTRGTGGGEYGLTINNVVQKYNNKLEFEKDVYLHFPFIEYNSAFFFNYWDTELLGTMKLDRRYDLVAKFFRLDSLNEYNDIAVAKLKETKKELKDAQDEFNKLVLKNEYTLQIYKGLLDEINGKPTRVSLETLIENYKKKREYILESDKLISSKGKLISSWEMAKEALKEAESAYNLFANKLKGKPSEYEVSKSVSEFKKRQELQSRCDKGNELITIEKSNLNQLKTELLSAKTNLEITDVGEVKEAIPSSLITDLEKKMEKVTLKYSNEIAETEFIIRSLISDKNKILDDLDHSKNKPNCSECGHPLSIESKIKSLNNQSSELDKKIKSETEKLEYVNAEFLNYKSTELVKLKEEKEDLVNKAQEIRIHNLKVNENKFAVSELTKKIDSLDEEIFSSESKLALYNKTISDLENELRSTKFITDKEHLDNQILLSVYSDLNKNKELFESKTLLFNKVDKIHEKNLDDVEELIKSTNKLLDPIKHIDEDSNLEAVLLLSKYNELEIIEKRVEVESKGLESLGLLVEDKTTEFTNLDTYCTLTSRSGEVLKSTLEDLTKTFSNGSFRFSTNKAQASGKVVTDMSVEYLVGKQWVTYPALSSGQKTLCDLYFISKVVTGVGVMSFDETLRFLDSENMKIASDLIVDIKKHNLLISTHSPDLHLMEATTLYCTLDRDSRTKVSTL